MKRILTTMVALSLLALSSAPVRADISPSLVSVTGSASNWTWTYHSVLSDAQELMFNPSASIPTPPVAKLDIMPGISSKVFDFYTIYDFAGFIPGSNFQPANWHFLFYNVGSTPGSVVAQDNPNVPNLTWYYDGPKKTGVELIAGDLGLFGAHSLYRTETNGIFAGSATKHDPANSPPDGWIQQNIGSVNVPVVPEPSTFVLFGAGLVGAVIMKRRAKK